MRASRTWILGLAALGLSCLGAPASAQLPGFLPNMSGGIDGRRGAYIDQVNLGSIRANTSSERVFAFAGEAGNAGQHRSMRLPMDQTTARLQELVNTIDASWGDRPRAGETSVHILASTRYDAKALPDGSIMVSLGLISSADSDADLAFIVAHELSHIRLGHFADDQAFRERRRELNAMAGQYWRVYALTKTRVRERSDSFELYNSNERGTREALGEAQAANDMLETALDLMIAPAMTRGQEDQADALGSDLAFMAGFDVMTGSQAGIRKNGADFALREEAVSRYRAQITETTALLNSDASQRALEQGRVGDVADALLQNMLSGGLRRGGELLSGFFRQTHRTPDARIQGLSRYYNAVPMYQDYLGGELSATWLTSIRDTDEMREAEIAVTAIEAAEDHRLTGDLPKALESLQPALGGRFKETPAIANVAARIYGAAGEIDTADRIYWQAHADSEQSLEAYVEHAELMAEVRRYDDARRVIAAGGQAYLASLPSGATPTPGAEENAFLPVLVDMAFAERDEAKQSLYFGRCVRSGEPELREACIINAFAPSNFNELPPERQAQIAQLASDAGRDQAVGFDAGAALGGLGRLLGGN